MQEGFTTDNSRAELERMRPYLRIPMTNKLVTSAACIILGPGFTLRGKNGITKGKNRLTWMKEKRRDGIYYTFFLFQRREPVRRLVYRNRMLVEIAEQGTPLHFMLKWEGKDQKIPSRIICPKTREQMYVWVDSAGGFQAKKLNLKAPETTKDKKPRYIRQRPASN